jgi:hypothetical protein
VAATDVGRLQCLERPIGERRGPRPAAGEAERDEGLVLGFLLCGAAERFEAVAAILVERVEPWGVDAIAPGQTPRGQPERAAADRRRAHARPRVDAAHDLGVKSTLSGRICDVPITVTVRRRGV